MDIIISIGVLLVFLFVALWWFKTMSSLKESGTKIVNNTYYLEQELKKNNELLAEIKTLLRAQQQ